MRAARIINRKKSKEQRSSEIRLKVYEQDDDDAIAFRVGKNQEFQHTSLDNIRRSWHRYGMRSVNQSFRIFNLENFFS